jgi:hypothetical protein
MPTTRTGLDLQHADRSVDASRRGRDIPYLGAAANKPSC